MGRSSSSMKTNRSAAAVSSRTRFRAAAIPGFGSTTDLTSGSPRRPPVRPLAGHIIVDDKDIAIHVHAPGLIEQHRQDLGEIVGPAVGEDCQSHLAFGSMHRHRHRIRVVKRRYLVCAAHGDHSSAAAASAPVLPLSGARPQVRPDRVGRTRKVHQQRDTDPASGSRGTLVAG